MSPVTMTTVKPAASPCRARVPMRSSRLVSLDFEKRDIESPDDVFDVGQLHHQIFRHGRPVGLVGLVNVVPERRAFHVEGNRQVARGLFRHHFRQDSGESESGIGGKSFRIGKAGADGMVGPVDIGAAVDEIECGWIGHEIAFMVPVSV